MMSSAGVSEATTGRAVEIAEHERPDAVGVAEGEQRVLAQHDRGERAA